MRTQSKSRIAPMRLRPMRIQISGTVLNPRGGGEVAKAKAINGRMSKKVTCSLMGMPITLPILSDETITF
jgi:hypothetical protein